MQATALKILQNSWMNSVSMDIGLRDRVVAGDTNCIATAAEWRRESNMKEY